MSNQLNGKTGKHYWRSLDELKDTPQFREFLEREFPQGAAEMENNEWSRRSFLTLMGASMALAGLAGCRRPVEKIVPYVTQPEEVTLGKPTYYATTMPLGLSSYGLLVTTHEGRPTKIHGNPDHPSSLGSSNIHTEASILGLYDPDRSRGPKQKNSDTNWAAFDAFWSEQYKKFSATQGEGLALLTEEFASPTLWRLLQDFKKAFPKATAVTYEPVSDENRFEGIRLATGRVLTPVYDYAKAEVILSLDSDFLRGESDNITATRGFADGRRVLSQSDAMNRLYIAESYYSITGTLADHRLRMQAGQVPAFALAVAKALSGSGVCVDGVSAASASSEFDQKFVNGIVADLMRARGKSLVVAGRRQPPVVHALAFAINLALGNIGTTVSYHESTDAAVSSRTALGELASKMKAGQVKTLVMLGSNPVYNAPADLDFGSALTKVEHTVHLSSHVDETSTTSEWHLPLAHSLESWSDSRSSDGTMGVIQPMIEPLFDGKSSVEVLNQLVTGAEKKGHEIVRETWQKILPALDFDKQWRRTLHDGLLKKSASPTVSSSIDSRVLASAVAAYPFTDANADKVELVFYTGNLYDGRFANIGWLQELPDPLTKITWDNAALMSQKTAQKIGVNNGEMVQLQVNGRKLDMPAWISPGQADNSVAVALGYGRKNVGRVADNVGFNTYVLRTNSEGDFISGLSVSKGTGTYQLSQTQEHWSMEGRPLVREESHEDYKKKPEFKPEPPEHPPLASMWDEHKFTDPYQWGMVIDLNVCTGCNACTIACQSENNIPVVGKEQVYRNREMHWIRLDRYFAGNDIDNPEVVHQPMGCQHCEMAPCETVCPVAATSHSSEGLNMMVYNRCIGTRYCSNNCPFKVRRFNFFNYTKETPETVRMANNPEVTVRFRGVMEKCTYCVQRISAAKFNAKSEGRMANDSDLMTACQQACPAKAITFGNIADPKSKVAELKKNDRNYRLLEEFNLRTRTSYLAKLRNPNPELS